ncbi:MAG TPA: hypothetical protein VIU93_06385 [Gallionellaceae bacterium]
MQDLSLCTPLQIAAAKKISYDLPQFIGLSRHQSSGGGAMTDVLAGYAGKIVTVDHSGLYNPAHLPVMWET